MATGQTNRSGEDGEGPDEPTEEEIRKADRVARAEMLRATGTYSFIGIEFGVAVLAGYFGGKWLDEWLGTAPWLTFLCMAIGFAAAGRDLYRLVLKHQRQLSEEENKP